MNARQIESLQTSWDHASPIAETVVRLFYRRLFELAPEVRERFQTSMSEQSDHLLAATREMVAQIDSGAGDTLSAELYQGEYESAVVDAWLWALEQELGRCASRGACDAWRDAIQSEAGTTFKLVALGELALIAG